MAGLLTANMYIAFFVIFALLVLISASVMIVRVKRQNLELKATNAELLTSREIAEDAFDRAKLAMEAETRFIQNMNHELRTPLNAVLGFSQILGLPDEFVSSEERQNYVDYIKENAELLLMIVNDMMCVSEVERGQFHISYAPVSVSALCGSAIRNVSHRVASDVELNLEDLLPENYVINTDAKRVTQVIMNLLTNSAKNTEFGKITLTVTPTSDGGARFCVTDTGCGIPKESIPFIFDRFYKVDANKQGAGLGLNTCLSISKCMGARIYIDTSYNEGTRFYFIVPNHTED